MRCASALPLRSTEPGLGAELLGDGFFRIRSNATAALAAVAALAPGEAYAVSYLSPLDEVAGANAWLMNFLNSTTPPSVAFYYDIVRVPDQVWKNGTANKIDLNSYLLDTLGYDCVLESGGGVGPGFVRQLPPRVPELQLRRGWPGPHVHAAVAGFAALRVGGTV